MHVSKDAPTESFYAVGSRGGGGRAVTLPKAHGSSAQRTLAWWRIQYVPAGKTTSVLPSRHRASAWRYWLRKACRCRMRSIRFHLSRQAMRGLILPRGSRVLGLRRKCFILPMVQEASMSLEQACASFLNP